MIIVYLLETIRHGIENIFSSSIPSFFLFHLLEVERYFDILFTYAPVLFISWSTITFSVFHFSSVFLRTFPPLVVLSLFLKSKIFQKDTFETWKRNYLEKIIFYKLVRIFPHLSIPVSYRFYIIYLSRFIPINSHNLISN